jgi:WD40 repeat protein
MVYPNTKKRYRISKKNETYWWDCVAFHPNGSVLTTLSSPHCVLQHWDITTRKLIDEITLSYHNPLNARTICFLPNGTELIVALPKKCVIVPIPFKVLYSPETQKKLYYFLSFLKNYSPESCDMLPNDIITLLMRSMLIVLRC